MKIVRAMKQISRIQGEMKDIKHRIQKSLSTLSENEFDEKFEYLWGLYNEKQKKLIQLKSAVMKVNISNNMFTIILRMGELKSYLTFLRELNPQIGAQEIRYSETVTVYKSQITPLNKIKAIENTQNEINRLTDILDDFNAKTDIEETNVVVQSLPEINNRP